MLIKKIYHETFFCYHSLVIDLITGLLFVWSGWVLASPISPPKPLFISIRGVFIGVQILSMPEKFFRRIEHALQILFYHMIIYLSTLLLHNFTND